MPQLHVRFFSKLPFCLCGSDKDDWGAYGMNVVSEGGYAVTWLWAFVFGSFEFRGVPGRRAGAVGCPCNRCLNLAPLHLDAHITQCISPKREKTRAEGPDSRKASLQK